MEGNKMYKVIPDLEESSDEINFYLLANEKALGTAISRAMAVSPYGTCRVVKHSSKLRHRIKELKQDLRRAEEALAQADKTIGTLRKELTSAMAMSRDYANDNHNLSSQLDEETKAKKYWTKRYWAEHNRVKQADTKQQLALPLNPSVEVQQKVEAETWGFTCRPSLEDLEIIRAYRPLLYDAVCLRFMDDGTVVAYKNVGGALGVSPVRARQLVDNAFKVVYWHKKGQPLKPYKPRWSVNATSNAMTV